MSRSKMLLVAGFGVCLTALGFFAGQSIGKEGDKPRIYELRIYTTLEGRMPALHARFRDHTIKLFEKHGMENGMYWVSADDPNKLIYVVSHASREAAKKSWADFVADPDWKKAKEASEKAGPILAKPPEAIYMNLTDYSPQPKS